MGCKTCCKVCVGVPVAIIILVIAVAIPMLKPELPCKVDVNGVCKQVVEGESAKCDDGYFVRLTHQKTIGARHFEEGQTFAVYSANECSGTFAISCSIEKTWQVEENWVCKDSSKTPKSAKIPLSTALVSCSTSENKVHSLVSVIEFSFETVSEAGPQMGCVGVWNPKALPTIAKVRGSVSEQTKAIIDAKEAVGGCPTAATYEDHVARAQDFATEFNPLFAWVIKQHILFGKEKITVFEKGNHPKSADFKLVALFMSLIVTGKGPKGGAAALSLSNCGAPTISMMPTPGVQVTRHADVGKLIADPTGKRAIIIGSGYAECCFDKTLPVFVSAGTPEHTQVRQLWDKVGMAIMEDKDLPPIAPQPASTFQSLRRKLMDTAGFTLPMPDEVAPLVAPMFLEILWGKKPTVEEAAYISTYMSVGGPCIMGSVVGKLPIVPGKIIAVREFALEFAKTSPVGVAMAQEIEKSDYKELRKSYEDRPKGIVGTAIQNLVDASLFAGMVGTTTLTINCVAALSQGPEFVTMFRKNSTAFMIETNRVTSAVAGSQVELKEEWHFVLHGSMVRMPKGTQIMQGTGFGAGLDGKVFPDPLTFNSSRPNLGQTMNWNGITEAVLARDYKRAPRFCPGAAASIKIAAKVCDHLTKDWKAA